MKTTPVRRLASRLVPVATLLFGFALLVVFAGCGNSAPAGSTTTSGAPTVTIAANPTSVASGGPSVLTVTATNATQVTVTGTNGSSYTLQASGGTQSVSPTATTTYTATATGSGGTITATAIVTVAGSSTAPTVTISASPTSVSAGTPSILTVAATNATSVTVAGSDGSSYTLQPSGGAPSVSPSATTTYTATATGPGGTVTATATVTVVGVSLTPTVTISAFPDSITTGTSSLLTVAATNATTVTVTGGGATYTLPATGGPQAVNPTVTTVYTATATGTGGTVTATATVTVVAANPLPTVTITANPTSLLPGGSSTLTVDSANATGVTITGSDGSSYVLPSPTGGTQVVTPAATTAYTATATGPGGMATARASVTVTSTSAPTVTIEPNPTTIASGNSSLLTVTAINATAVTITGSDGSSYTLQPTGGMQAVSPTATTTYTATATGAGVNVPASGTVTVVAPGTVDNIDHVIFMLQENRTFDTYFGMLNNYRQTSNPPLNVGANGFTYNVDGIDTIVNAQPNTNDEGVTFPLFKFATTCIDDMSSAWLESYGDVNTFDFLATRSIDMGGFVHTAEGFAKSACPSGSCPAYTDLAGQRAMGYYDQGFLNYYYDMASQFALSDRWFSPFASKTIDNRIATMTGGTTQGLTKDPGSNDHLGQLNINNIFEELDKANVSWKIYYGATQGGCADEDECQNNGASALYPAVNFSILSYSFQYLHENKTGTCAAPTLPSSVVGDTDNTFCIDPTHIAPIAQYFTDLTNGTLPSFAFIEPGYAVNDEHPGFQGSILVGQTQVASIMNALMASPEWKDSVFFFGYDEGGGPYDHVPPVPGHTNDFTNTTAVEGTNPDPADPLSDIGSISVNPDNIAAGTPMQDNTNFPCIPLGPSGTPLDTAPATLHCDLTGPANTEPGATPGDAPFNSGFAAQLGFRIPNMVISPFTLAHYVSHTPMDHTAVIQFVENRFIGNTFTAPYPAHLTFRDAAQPNLLNFFDFTANGDTGPWATPPTPPTPDPPNPANCTPTNLGTP